MNNILHQYQNGNIVVKLFDDGTKIREFAGIPSPIQPESIDVKITNNCLPTEGNPICAFCHEKSGPNGKHADLDKLLEVLSELKAGTEIACGGGNSLSHPDLIRFLTTLKSRGLIANITINQKHLKESKDLILSLIAQDLVKGIGISYSDEQYLYDIEPILKATDNVVFHLIMGINQVEDITLLNSFCKANNKECKILILGYKQFGFGINYYIKHKEVEDIKYKWHSQLASQFNRKNLILSFDNLAITQLKLQRFFPDDKWKEFYMGNDGQFSMFIDAVEQQFAKSSTSSDRKPFNDIGVMSYFQSQRTP